MTKILFLVSLCLSNTIYAYDKYDLMICSAESHESSRNDCFIALGLSSEEIVKIEIDRAEEEDKKQKGKEQERIKVELLAKQKQEEEDQRRQDKILRDLERSEQKRRAESFNDYMSNTTKSMSFHDCISVKNRMISSLGVSSLPACRRTRERINPSMA
tara:strand:+ start:9259 stop:9732 length:474 start_codon:yes stop_codon:yes gene_type:complete